MKKFLSILSFLFVISAQAGDILTLNNQNQFEGKVVKIKDCTIVFKLDGHKYHIPASDIYTIEFESHTSKVYTDYIESIALLNTDLCLSGKMDATLAHGKKGGHFILGVLFGPFAMLGTAMANPTPYKAANIHLISDSKENFSDPIYLNCYKRKAKGELILWEAAGWLAWLFFAAASA